MKQMNRYQVGILTAVMLALAAIVGPATVQAGVYSNNSEATYTEYWIDHTQFTGGCEDNGSPTNPIGTFYAEPWRLDKCPKTMTFTISEDVSAATKVEIYLDLWRNYDFQAARFKLNNHATVYSPNVGNDWSRTPWVGEVNKSELQQGTNTITFWGEQKYHIHDVAIRVYNNGANAPTGQLLTIEDDNGEKAANSGGTLMVNNDELTLKANVSNAAFVEFHAWYEGYDEDNDKIFRDWHNVGRNNWHPGGRPSVNEPPPDDIGGTIDHVGTVDVANGQASITWDIPHITNQAQIKFKIRVVDENGNVRDAAGGQSATFKLMRNRPVLAYLINDFDDVGLHMGGDRPDTAEYRFTMPSNVNSFNNAYLLGHYWRQPRFAINDGSPAYVNGAPDAWMLQIRSINSSLFKVGSNRIVFSWVSGSGNFIEHPGPMFVLRKTAASPDTTPPFVSGQNPAPGAVGVDEKASVVVHVNDIDFGVDFTTVRLRINGNDVTGNTKMFGVSSDYTLTYKPPQPFAFESVVNVGVDACDLVGNCMNAVNYSFTVEEKDVTPPVISNVVVDARPEGARITWTTNEPATSRVDYGQTTNYELGNVADITLVTVHEIELSGLTPEMLYHFRIQSADELNNTATTPDDTFTTPVYPPATSDDFNSCQLDDLLWEFQNPLGDATLFMNGEQLELSVPGGVAHDFSAGNKSAAIMQKVENEDFSLEVKFNSPVSQPVQSQGVLIENVEDTYIRIGFEYTKNGTLILFSSFINDGAQGTTPINTDLVDIPPVITSLYLRVVRSGNSWTPTYSYDGVNWKNSGNRTFELPVSKVGVFVGNAHNVGNDAPAHTAVVDYFFNSANPIVPEDGQPISVDEGVVGNGTVIVDPNLPKYICGAPVSLTAVPQPGWTFAGWSGTVISATNPLNFAIDGPEVITGTFTQDQYTLTVNIQPEGAGAAGNTVTKSPNQPTYVYGNTVTLTAAPGAGFFFGGWQDDLVGAENPVEYTVTKNTQITAIFTDNPPPVVDPIADRTVLVGQSVAIEVQASDADGSTPTLRADGLPPGASFVDNGDGTGSFSWTPGVGDRGEHVITFIAQDSNGIGVGSQTVTITVEGYALALPAVLR